MNRKNSALALTRSACLEKACALLLALQPTAPDLVLMLGLEVLLWMA
jgi:hypothetical protein